MEQITDTLSSVKNGLRILRLFSTETPELGVTEIARRLELHKTTVHRLITVLEKEGFVEQNKKTRKYRLGLSVLHLSGIVDLHTEIFKDALPVLNALMKKTTEAVHLSVLEDDRVVYLYKIECPHPVRLLSHIGRSNPCTCTSSGKVILAFSPKTIVENIVDRGLPKYGPNSVTDRNEFIRQLAAIRQQGYAVCIDELHEGATSIAAPVRDYSGEVIAAVSIIGPNQRITQANIPQLVRLACQAARDISSLLGYYE
ncbi:IclR family transcriptional regulator [Geobacillus thermodenitrificans]|uniref:IclR family transcriptional regulator n=1 Tax=Geobacillus thermodenitrificans TaxID=33940 RepID=UPI000C29287A|nr:IclR family transcriptional regulator [Geobacillus thermodenitrificans]MED3717857.1 IclR family transcriptional regulator [Geobacillus thermodenitrificans]MED4916969.1 IclR family transcriptional regulator [Geobacillus thermodenitrificans]PJW20487.1 IclR family transcriptional regulator [Geobacillus thermodenitrificans]